MAHPYPPADDKKKISLRRAVPSLINAISHPRFRIKLTLLGAVVISAFAVIRLLQLLWFEGSDAGSNEMTIRSWMIFELSLMSIGLIPSFSALAGLGKTHDKLLRAGVWFTFYGVYCTIPSYILHYGLELFKLGFLFHLERPQNTCNATEMIEYVHEVTTMKPLWDWETWNPLSIFSNLFGLPFSVMIPALFFVTCYCILLLHTFCGASRVEIERYIRRLKTEHDTLREEDMVFYGEDEEVRESTIVPESNEYV